jgi:tetratricopeptide (TPR) repeat protein
MNIIEQYESLVDAEKWHKALPVIKEIIDRNPNIDTSWFNYGVCLDEIGQHAQAASAFIKAHELNVSDYGIHYRIIRSLILAQDYGQLYEFVDYVCQAFEEEIETVFESEEMKAVLQRGEFMELRSRYYHK